MNKYNRKNPYELKKLPKSIRPRPLFSLADREGLYSLVSASPWKRKRKNMSKRPNYCPICNAKAHYSPKENKPMSTDVEDYEVAGYLCGAWYSRKGILHFPYKTLKIHNEWYKNYIKELKKLIAEVIPFIEHNKAMVEPGHCCSNPNSCCDMTCMNDANDEKLLLKLRKTLNE